MIYKISSGVIRHLKKNPLLYIIVLAFFLVRIVYRSPWLEDWDAVQFSLGLHYYSVALHQPHPPGYPIYILLGRFFYSFFQNDVQTLTFMSALFGSLTAIPLFFLSQKMFNRQTAYLTVILFLLIPVHWILSEAPISNVTGLFFLTIFAYLAYIFAEDLHKIKYVGLFAGLILGVRLTDFPIIGGLLFLLIIRKLNLSYSIRLLGFFILGILMWLIPLILISGAESFSNSYLVIANWFAHHESSIPQTFGLKYYFKSKWLNLWDHLQVSYTWYFIIPAILGTFLIFKENKFWTIFKYQFLIIWTISYGIILFTLYNLDLPQYTLPLSIPAAILSAHLFITIFHHNFFKLAGYVSLVIVIIMSFLYGYGQVKGQATKIPPTIAPVLFVKDNFSPQNTLLITTFTYRQFQYYAPEFKNYYGIETIPPKLNEDIVIIDYKPLKDDVPALKNYRIINSKVFSEAELYLPRIHETKLFILTK